MKIKSSKMFSMSVIKRSGRKEKVSFDKIIMRIEQLCWDLDPKYIDPIDIAKETIKMMHNDITTEEIDQVSADVCANRIMEHPDFNKLAARIAVSNLHKATTESFFDVTEKLYSNTDSRGELNRLVTQNYYEVVCNNKDEIQKKLDFDRDYLLSFFGIKTLERAYLIRVKNGENHSISKQEKKLNSKYGKIVERPQHLWMRVAIGIHGQDLKRAFETYDLISQKYFTHASPTLYNAGSQRAQLSSCYLMNMDDSIDGIFKTISDCAQISKWAGGIGIHISSVRSAGSVIRGTNGASDGVIPMCRVLNSVARYVNQGGRRKGAIAIYFEPWHPDALELIDLRRPIGDEEMRARDLFLALWIPDLFMERVKDGGKWSFFCPDECPGLKEAYGEDFNKLYLKYEEEGRARSTIPASQIWEKILVAQIETGMPYMCFKDHANRKSNQKNLGTIQSSNLCVDGDTDILTDKGFIKIKLLKNNKTKVWNGFEFSDVEIKQTGENKLLDRITFSNGKTLECTPQHKFYIQQNTQNPISCSDLTVGNEIINYTLPILDEITNECVDYVQKKDISITKIERGIKKANTYCFTEPLRHMGVFNGILTGQCSEIYEYSDSNETAVCFTGNTEILTKKGLRKIKDCDNEEIYSYFDNDQSLQQSEHYEKAKLISNGVKEVYELIIEGQKPIKVTKDHPFLVRTGINMNTNKNTYVWKKVSELRTDDNIVTPQLSCNPYFNIKIKDNIDNEWLSVGWIISDKWTSDKGWGDCFEPDDKKAQNVVIKQIDKWQTSIKSTSYKKSNSVINRRLSKQLFKDFMADKFGFERTATQKRIYDKIKFAKPIQIANFLSGLFSSDGEVALSCNKLSICLNSSSDDLLYDAQSLLLNFGIKSKVQFSEVNTQKDCVQGTLEIYDIYNCDKFMEHIGFNLCPQKEEKYKNAKKLLETFKNTPINSMLTEIAKVKSVKQIGKEHVYDLSLPKSHNFIVSGCVVHNCNLASISLPAYIKEGSSGLEYDFQKLYEVTRVVTRNLNKVIDVNYYPTPETKNSNMRHRPIGLGVQGLADVFNQFKFSFESQEARDLNKKIFETIYFGSLTESCEMAKEDGHYETFKGSPFSEGKLQWHLWGLNKKDLLMNWDWDSLIEDIKKHGTRNSLLTAIMPTASTSQIMGNNEMIEPYTSNMYVRNTIAGEYLVLNEHLVKDLIKLNMWNEDIRNEILYDNGSIQKIKTIPDDIKAVYKTAFELSQKDLLTLEIERGPFIDQGASHNNFMGQPDFKRLTLAHFYAWKNGLKTGQYYLRSQTAVNATKFGLDATTRLAIEKKRGVQYNEKKITKQASNDDDPRNLNEIEQNIKPTIQKVNKWARPDNLTDCEMCSG
uniref:ribonucleoside-diphosphate reductase n=1 Tax=viral metagenome TaxID=1070528 RepID=A0A6C0ACG1_9ZZZZ